METVTRKAKKVLPLFIPFSPEVALSFSAGAMSFLSEEVMQEIARCTMQPIEKVNLTLHILDSSFQDSVYLWKRERNRPTQWQERKHLNPSRFWKKP